MSLSNKLNTFSIILPTWNRASILPKAINSVLDQTYPHWELIIIDDGSTDETKKILLDKYASNPKIKIITHQKSLERVIGWNHGMQAATKDWLCFLDSDDEWIYGYLEILNHNINLYPEYDMFNFGHIVMSLTGSTIKLGVALEEDEVGMKHFDTGKLGAGSYIFKRTCLEKSGYLPEINNVFDFADWFGEEVKKYWAAKKLSPPVPLYNRDDRWCGNPWGQDYVLAWLVTRHFKTKKLPINPYIAYIRTEPWMYERAIISGTMNA